LLKQNHSTRKISFCCGKTIKKAKMSEVNNNELNGDDLAPPGCVPLSHQVAGHFHGNKRTKLGLLETGNGCILKAVQSPPRGIRELKFYEKIFKSAVDDLNKDEIEIRKIIPIFYDTVIHNDVYYIKMTDIGFGIIEPSVIDMKMGRTTHDPEADDAKMTRQKLKYPPCENIGFQLMGMRIKERIDGNFKRFDKYFGRSRREEDLIHCLGLFFQLNYSDSHQKRAIAEVINKLSEIKDWFTVQTTYHFFAASILTIYETNLEEIAKNANDEQIKDLVRVKLVDLTHVFPANGKMDENFLFGLNNLMEYHDRLLLHDYRYQDPTTFSLAIDPSATD